MAEEKTDDIYNNAIRAMVEYKAPTRRQDNRRGRRRFNPGEILGDIFEAIFDGFLR